MDEDDDQHRVEYGVSSDTSSEGEPNEIQTSDMDDDLESSERQVLAFMNSRQRILTDLNAGNSARTSTDEVTTQEREDEAEGARRHRRQQEITPMRTLRRIYEISEQRTEATIAAETGTTPQATHESPITSGSNLIPGVTGPEEITIDDESDSEEPTFPRLSWPLAPSNRTVNNLWTNAGYNANTKSRVVGKRPHSRWREVDKRALEMLSDDVGDDAVLYGSLRKDRETYEAAADRMTSYHVIASYTKYTGLVHHAMKQVMKPVDRKEGVRKIIQRAEKARQTLLAEARDAAREVEESGIREEMSRVEREEGEGAEFSDDEAGRLTDDDDEDDSDDEAME